MCYHKPQYNIKYTDAQKQYIYCASTNRVVYDLIYNIFQLVYLISEKQFLYGESNITHHQQLHQDNDRW